MGSLADYVVVPKQVIVPRRALKADLYLYLPKNDSIVHYRRRGDILTPEDCESMQKLPGQSLLILKTDMQRLLHGTATVLKESIARGDLTSEEVRSAASEMIRSIDAVPAEEPNRANENARLMLAKLGELVQGILRQLQASASTVAYDEVLKSLQNSDDPLQAHNQQVSALSALMMLSEGNANQDELADLATAGLVHDLGLARIPKQVADKYLSNGAESFTPSEKLLYIRHPHFSLEMVRETQTQVTAGLASTVECHHECWDGSGFRGLKQQKIPRPARFLKLADDIVGLLNDTRQNLLFKDTLAIITHRGMLTYDLSIVSIIHRQYLEANDT